MYVKIWKIYRRLYDCITPPVIQTFVKFSIFNLHFLSWYYTWNAETWQGYYSKGVLSSAGIRFQFWLIWIFGRHFGEGSITDKLSEYSAIIQECIDFLLVERLKVLICETGIYDERHNIDPWGNLWSLNWQFTEETDWPNWSKFFHWLGHWTHHGRSR